MATRIQVRRDTAANWAATNPVLAQGEIGLEIDTGNFKFGNTVGDEWNSLPYAGAGGGGGATNFLMLTDTPSSYAGQDGRFIWVNGTDLEFHVLEAADSLFDPTGTGLVSTTVQAAIVELAASGGTDDQTATEVPFTPAGGVAAANVQAAIVEVAGDAASVAGGLADHISDSSDAHDASAISFVAGSGIAATNVQAAVVEVASDAAAALDAHTSDTTDAHDASAISFVPGAGITSSNVQAAINELATLGNVSSVAGYTGVITQSQLREGAGVFDPTSAVDSGSGDDSIIVMVCPGNSQTGGWLGGNYPTTITTNPNLYVWQAAADSQSGTWQNVNFGGSAHSTTTSQYLGHCGGNVATNWYFAADRVQRKTGKKVFCIVSYQSGAPSILFDPARGNSNGAYDYGQSPVVNNNMWYWTSTAVNNAMTALRAGSSGAPAAYPAKNFVDVVYGDIATGDAIGAVGSTTPAPYWTIAESEPQYVTAIQNFISGAETSGGIGGWAKPWYTRWLFNDVPAGSEAGGTAPTYEYVFETFTANYQLVNAARSLVWSVPVPTGKQTATATAIGTIDSVHWNSNTQAQIGSKAGDMILNQPSQRSRVVDRSTPILEPFISGQVDVASAIAFDFDTVYSMTDTNTRLARFRNAGGATFLIDKTAEIITPTFFSNYLGGGNALFVGGAGFGTGVINSGVADGPNVVGFTLTTNNAIAGSGATLLKVRNTSGGATFTVDKTAEIITPRFFSDYLAGGNALFVGGAGFGTGVLNSGVTDGTNVVGFTLTTNNAIAGSGATLLKVRNTAGGAVFTVDKTAEIITPRFYSDYLGGGNALFVGGAGFGTGVINSGVADGASANAFTFTSNSTLSNLTSSLALFKNNTTNALRVSYDGSTTVGITSGQSRSFGFGTAGDIYTQTAAMRYAESTQLLQLIQFGGGGDADYHMTVKPDAVGFGYRDIANPNGVWFVYSSSQCVLTAGAMNAPGTASQELKIKSTALDIEDGAGGTSLTSLAGTLSRNVVAGADGTLSAAGQASTYVYATVTTTDASATTIVGGYIPADGDTGQVTMAVTANRTDGTRGSYSGLFNVTFTKSGSTITCSDGAFSGNVCVLTPYDVAYTGTGNTLVVQANDVLSGFSIRVVGQASQTWVWKIDYVRRILS